MNSLTREQSRRVDRLAEERFGICGLVLMENAGLLATLDLAADLPERGSIAVVCGGGNNGGDGYVIARQLSNRGHAVRLFATHAVERMRGDGRVNREIVDAMGLAVVPVDTEQAIEAALASLAPVDLTVDALFGTGFHGEVRAPFDQLIDGWNEIAAPCVAIDVPSGLDADTGAAASATIRATRTLTFVAPKRGYDAPGAQPYLGEVRVLPIGAPPETITLALEEGS